MQIKASLLAVFGLIVTTQTFAYQYSVKDLGSLGGVTQGGITYSQPTAINNRGDVVGASYVGFTLIHGFLSSNHVMTDLTANAKAYANALGISDSGTVVGQFDSRPYIYLNGNLQTLAFFGTATGIDNNNQVVGTNYQTHRAYLYSNGTIKDLGTLGGTTSEANGISSSGIVVGGSYTTGNSSYDAFVYSNGIMEALNIGDPSQGVYAKSVNNAGQVVGRVGANAFLYEEGSLIDLSKILTGSLSMAESINNYGQVVGWSTTTDGSSAFLYENGGIQDLSTVLLDHGWTDTIATAINDNGEIAGMGSLNGETHAFIMLPVIAAAVNVPEPATYWLVILGLATMAYDQRTKRSRI
jgi:probable HAF family extracellular repeat protein